MSHDKRCKSKENESQILKKTRKKIQIGLQDYHRGQEPREYPLNFKKLGRDFGRNNPRCDDWLKSKDGNELVIVEIEFHGNPQINMLKICFYISEGGKFDELGACPKKVRVIHLVSDKINPYNVELTTFLEGELFNKIKESAGFNLRYDLMDFEFPQEKELHEFEENDIESVSDDLSGSVIELLKPL